MSEAKQAGRCEARWNRDNWPIAAAMNGFPGVLPDGSLVQDQPADHWAETLQQVVDAGFTEFDPSDSWVRVADLSPSRLRDFMYVVKTVGLTIPAISTTRKASVIDPVHGDDYLAYNHRVIDTAAGDLGMSAARKFDCEAWVPTQDAFRELTSTSNCTEYQARRLNIRERMEDGGTRPVSTLNGTLATTRWLVAILENHQQPDGSVRVPAALVPYVGTEVLTP